MIRKAAVWVVVIALGLVGGRIYGCTQHAAGARDAKAEEQREASRALVAANKNWLKHVARVIDSVKADTIRAAESKARADARRTKRPAVSDTTNWKARADDLEAEVTDLRKAFADQQRATANLLPAIEEDTAKVAETTEHLDLALDREGMAGRFKIPLLGGSLPKPPKWLAATLGCAAGGALGAGATRRPEDKLRNAAQGCTAGAAALVIAVPTD